MVSIPLFVLLLATYAYSVPVGINDNVSKQNEPSKPRIMHLIDDEESTPVPTFGQDTLTTGKNGLPMTTPSSLVNNERAPRETLESLSVSQVEVLARGVEESSTLFPTTVETSSESRFRPRKIEESSTLFPTTAETSSQSGFRPREIEESSTLSSSSMETSSPSEFQPRGMEESSTLFPSTLETSTQFNQRKIRGENVEIGMDLQTTEEPSSSSSVSSFAQTTGLLRNQRGNQAEEQESTSASMDEATTEFSSTGRSNTVIEVIPGRNTKTEIIPGRNTKTEIISGGNTKTEIITSSSSRFINGNRVLSQGKN